MKRLLLLFAALLVAGCGESQQSAPSPEAKPAEPVTKDSNADKELFDAVKSGDIEAVEKRIAAGADISGKDDTGATVLHHAAIRGRHEMIKILLQAGGDVNAKMRNNNTPLHMAILGGAKKDVLLALLEGGANVNAQGRWTPLDAVDYGRSRSSSWRDETIDLLRKHGGKTKEELQDPSAPIKKLNSTADLALFGAVIHNNVEAAKKALANGADVNARGIMATKNTPLIHAATVGAKEIVELLIANGADVNAKIESGLFKGKTALDLAIKFNKPKTADLLRKHGGKTGEE